MRVQNYVPQFGLYSVDLAEFSDYYPYPHTVQFFGYRADGSVVSTSFTTDGIIDGTGPLADFQTFYFDESFAAIVRFEIPDYCYGYALDNLTLFRVVPEPSTGALLLGGGLVVWAVRSRRR
jgi:hypothetical protein